MSGELGNTHSGTAAVSQNSALIIFVIALSQFAVPYMFSGVGITLPAMGEAFHASALAISMVETIYIGVSCALLLPVGRLADISDKTLIFKFGLFLYALVTLIIGFQQQIELVIVLRAIQGVASAILLASGMGLLMDSVPVQQRGKAIGIVIGATYAGLASGPYLAGWITEHFGWRWVYYLSCIPIFISSILTHFTLKSQWQGLSKPMDWMGALLITLTILFLVAGSAFLGDSLMGVASFVAALALAVAFVVVEERAAHPMLRPSDLVKNKTLSFALLTQLLIYTGSVGITFLYAIYLQSIKGLSPAMAGQMMVISPLLMAFVAPFSGRLSDRMSPHGLTGMGLLLVMLSLLMAAQVDAGSSNGFIISIMVLQGIGFALFSSPNMTLIMNSVAASESGLASALAAKMRSLGMLFGMNTINILISINLGKQAITSNIAGFVAIMQNAFLLFSVLVALGIILTLADVRMSREKALIE